jgi:hypothetical protein
MSNKKELIWVDEGVAKKYAAALDDEAKRSIVLEVIAQQRKDFTEELRQLDDDVLQFRAICLTHRAALSGVYAEQSALVDKLWGEMSAPVASIAESAKKLAGTLNPIRDEIAFLRKEVALLNRDLDSLSVRDLSGVIDLAERVSRLTPATRELLQLMAKKKEGEPS